ncbi:MAG: DUF1156 domain-containing protein [Proteobacteria bacterium]|nr:DUF1156 domain-containing protein [Pseudomonadota bacterium]
MSAAIAPLASRRKLAEVGLPLDVISRTAAREKNRRIGHPCSFHVWWSRKPLAACRALTFAQLVDDPSSRPDLFPTERAQAEERDRLFGILSRLVEWEARADERLLAEARAAFEYSMGGQPPPVLDPFCGGGSIPLEALRLGLPAVGSDLNPVAVLLTRALTTLPARFAKARAVSGGDQTSIAPDGALSADVKFYGSWIRDRAVDRLGGLYPSARGCAVHAWLWVRTVQCPNPACRARAPLANKFALATRRGDRTWVEPQIEQGRFRYVIRTGADEIPTGTVKRGGAHCLGCRATIPLEHVRQEGMQGRLGADLVALALESSNGRRFAPADAEHERIAFAATPAWTPDGELPERALGFRVQRYGIRSYRDLFTARQLTALATFADLIGEARKRIREDARRAGMLDDGKPLHEGGEGATAYAEAVSVLLALAVGKLADYASTLCSWMDGQAKLGHTFVRQALAMTWDFAEGNPLSRSTGGYLRQVELISRVIDESSVPTTAAYVVQHDAKHPHPAARSCVVVTDPPYYDNIGYGDLADYFYVWLRPMLREVYPDLFATHLTPKEDELVAAVERFDGDRARAREFFEGGLAQAFAQMHDVQDPSFPLSIFYAFKQSVADAEGIGSTGWESMLEALIGAGFSITGTWPMRTESTSRLRSIGSNALASSIVLICRRRAAAVSAATRREFLSALRAELPTALAHLQRSNIAPVDLAQSAIGPGMAIYTRYSKVVDAEGEAVPVREALSLINQILDEVLAEQESDFDADTRWALAWFEQHGFDEGEYGVAETLSKAKNTSVAGMVEAGVIESRRGKVRLLSPDELPDNWDPATNGRLTVWEMVHHLIRVLESGGESAAADLAAQLGSRAEIARELAYRLYTVSERKKRAQDALRYNALVQSWPEISRLARESGARRAEQKTLFVGGEA